jgi:pimeloyl-ACP methyl ester carboxylesterase
MVERARPANGTGAPQPIIADLHGGPGFRNVGHNGLADLATALGRDVIVFDQRGTGASQPSLVCQEATDDRAVLALRDAEQRAAIRKHLATCRARLVRAGVDLDQYRLSTDAADVADLRTALGIDRWMYVGLSFGTKLGQAVLRDHPDGIDAVVLDSVQPLQDQVAEDAMNGRRAFDVLFDNCAADPTCAKEHPDLERRFDAWLAQLDAQPAVLDVDTVRITFDADFAVSALFEGLYDRTLIPLLPGLVEQGIAGDYSVIGPAILARTPTSERFSAGMATSLDCADRIPFVDDALLRRSAQPLGYGTLADPAPDAADCRLWDVTPSPMSVRRPVVSDVPTLVFTGEYDPITPPRYGEAVASRLSNSTVVQFKGEGHGHYDTPCGTALVKAFLDHPTAPVDGSCART